jgi:hypothetical protein
MDVRSRVSLGRDANGFDAQRWRQDREVCMRSPSIVERRAATFIVVLITVSISLGTLTDSRWYWLALIGGIHLWQSGVFTSWPAWGGLRDAHQRR